MRSDGYNLQHWIKCEAEESDSKLDIPLHTSPKEEVRKEAINANGHKAGVALFQPDKHSVQKRIFRYSIVAHKHIKDSIHIEEFVFTCERSR